MNIQSIVLDRKITNVVHFTQLKNLPSILKYGLIPRAQLEAKKLPFEFNDYQRIDNCVKASCLSISFPNYKMFYRYRIDNKNVEWVVICFSSSILWLKDCAFCIENAASNNVRHIPIAQRKGAFALNRLFDEFDYKPKRQLTGIPRNFPTDPQAEILVFDIIESKFIQDIRLQNNNSISQIKKQFPNYKYINDKQMFFPRSDWEDWKNLFM